ncbi:MAG: hypothetical protein AB7I49_16725 [Candidatus Nitrosocosmicus sp.]
MHNYLTLIHLISSWWNNISIANSSPLFKAFITIGILVCLFGLSFVFMDVVISSFTEGLREIGIRFIFIGIISIAIAYVYKHHIVISFILRNFKNKLIDQDRFSRWYKP